ncbi:hypothetical protein DPMN_023760 [Dreissena polymorpha]|uniref:Uncharacterized protein n=1 Tax=Dreissena polymorpha TaxID=45954 RepID=A0A9D4RBP3_DREPO|nr:hypothetical protein DPMN_023760 [Dreissena polymorpha]
MFWTIPPGRLYIETDAPFFGGPNIRTCSSPATVELAVRNFALIRKNSMRDVLASTATYVRTLYRISTHIRKLPISMIVSKSVLMSCGNKIIWSTESPTMAIYVICYSI